MLTQRERQREGVDGEEARPMGRGGERWGEVKASAEKKRDVWREYESGTGVPLMRSAWSRLTSGDLGQGR